MNCSTGKKLHLNEFDAVDALVESRIRSTLGANNIYQCDSCGYWHLTSSGDDLVIEREDLRLKIEEGIRASKWDS